MPLCSCFGHLALTHVQAQTTFRVTIIPEEAATEQIWNFTPLASDLEKQLGVIQRGPDSHEQDSDDSVRNASDGGVCRCDEL